MGKSLYIMLVGVIGVAMLSGGCAKKMKVGETEEVKEERIASESEAVEGIAEEGMREQEVSSTKPVEGGMGPGGLSVVLFDYDKFNIREDMRPVLKANAKWLQDNSNVSVSVQGHADERGTNEYNLALGERRAQATKRYLVSLGISKSRLSTISYGEERSVCSEKAESCYSKNRRSQFELRK